MGCVKQAALPTVEDFTPNRWKMLRTDQIASIDIESSINKPPKTGLDPLVDIVSLPMFTYKLTTSQVDHDDDEPTECSACLGTIMEESTVRLLCGVYRNVAWVTHNLPHMSHRG
ncbi:uncharacterized protein LOC111278155 [Durio zibethinus]|uniref:Uncharacterized protein LOC111278155 n=1 Tax=Durio zibethinus TaxID=66656 RepID=A0A6P5WWE7_DURZI|nr:uncharacterized protein LOC111278155 [Durio zibethinus]